MYICRMKRHCKRKSVVIIFLSLFSFTVLSQHVTEVKAEKGDGIHTLLDRYGLDSAHHVEKFITLNHSKLGHNQWLFAGEVYQLPVAVNLSQLTDDNKALDSNITCKTGYTIFGVNYKDVPVIDNSLQGAVYYLVSGHGGPDPGAQGTRSGNILCEDEYAYDVTLRLCRVLISYGATAYMIIRDSTDGIRDEQYLPCDNDEYCWPEESIPRNHLARLKQRADIVNKLYKENKSYAYQRAIILHVDSRTVGKRIDVFFYHYAKSVAGKKLADAMQKSLKQKYATYQPNRGYNGTVTPRDELFMIKKTLPPTVYIELGNIQNTLDQIRLIKPGNRQAIANWLAEGMIADYKAHNN